MKETDKNEQCQANKAAIDDALYVFGGKWKLPVVIALRKGYSRFGELQKAISGISAKALSNELKELEMNGLLMRKINAEDSTIYYQLTPYSNSMGEVFRSLSEWGANHKAKLRSERGK